MNGSSRFMLLAATSLALGFVGVQRADDPELARAERRFADAVAKIEDEAAKQRAAEAKKVLKVCRSAVEAATKAGDLDRAAALIEKVRWYEQISAEGRPRPKDRVEFGGHLYALIPEKATWHVAKARCEEMGGYLVCVESQEEDLFIAQLCQGHDVWLGASDEEKEDEWKWVNGAPLQYQNDTFEKSGGDAHHLCYLGARKWASRRRWDDEAAGIRRPFVCEWNR